MYKTRWFSFKENLISLLNNDMNNILSFAQTIKVKKYNTARRIIYG